MCAVVKVAAECFITRRMVSCAVAAGVSTAGEEAIRVQLTTVRLVPRLSPLLVVVIIIFITFIQGIYSFSLSRIMMSCLFLGMVLAVCTCSFQYVITLPSRLRFDLFWYMVMLVIIIIIIIITTTTTKVQGQSFALFK